MTTLSPCWWIEMAVFSKTLLYDQLPVSLSEWICICMSVCRMAWATAAGCSARPARLWCTASRVGSAAELPRCSGPTGVTNRLRKSGWGSTRRQQDIAVPAPWQSSIGLYHYLVISRSVHSGRGCVCSAAVQCAWVMLLGTVGVVRAGGHTGRQQDFAASGALAVYSLSSGVAREGRWGRAAPGGTPRGRHFWTKCMLFYHYTITTMGAIAVQTK